jgi:thiamine-monophosphate kinase
MCKKMPLDEFSLIKCYFSRPAITGEGVVVGVGDDCAVIKPQPGEQILVTTDSLIDGVHFPRSSDAGQVAKRALRVNLSDIAAMGGVPRWFSLALTVPGIDEKWLRNFSKGLNEVADEFGCWLVGGDTNRGPMSITISVLGSVPVGRELRRTGASARDTIYVTGSLGDAAAGLACIEGRLIAEDSDYLLKRFWYPTPRIQEAIILRDYASAAIDISDGLMADLQHIVGASGVGAEIEVEALPLSRELSRSVDRDLALNWALSAGDDYELCFTVPENKVPGLESLIRKGTLVASRIGRITAGGEIICRDANAKKVGVVEYGYRHF